ncbi:hypothetical protein ANN_04307 [Periplaneta americana]|uniref:Uncharacterized protein n=1 Tax=Periplaneta americana TaxID=6978 RepID=A0ABQ8T9D9_PERAM|nr:hypothetical protein ANN_04307 [Periplaneta americana]
MAGLCEGGNEPPGFLKAISRDSALSSPQPTTFYHLSSCMTGCISYDVAYFELDVPNCGGDGDGDGGGGGDGGKDDDDNNGYDDDEVKDCARKRENRWEQDQNCRVDDQTTPSQIPSKQLLCAEPYVDEHCHGGAQHLQ